MSPFSGSAYTYRCHPEHITTECKRCSVHAVLEALFVPLLGRLCIAFPCLKNYFREIAFFGVILIA